MSDEYIEDEENEEANAAAIGAAEDILGNLDDAWESFGEFGNSDITLDTTKMEEANALVSKAYRLITEWLDENAS